MKPQRIKSCMNSSGKSTYTIESLLKGLEVLSLFDRDTPALTLTEIVETAVINKSTAFRIVSTLESAGYLERDEETKRFRPGFRAVRLGMSALSGIELRDVALPYLHQLADQTQEVIGLAVLDESYAVYIERLFPRKSVTALPGVGSRLPACKTAVGKTLVACLADDKQKTWLEQYCPDEQLQVELAVIKANGYGFTHLNEEFSMGAKAVAAPIFDHDGEITAAINIAGILARMSDERVHGELVPLLRETTLHISRLLGYDG